MCGDGVEGRLPPHFCVTHEVSKRETVRVWLWRLEVRGKISRGKIFTPVPVIFFFLNFFLNSKKTSKKIKIKDCFTFVSLYDT